MISSNDSEFHSLFKCFYKDSDSFRETTWFPMVFPKIGDAILHIWSFQILTLDPKKVTLLTDGIVLLDTHLTLHSGKKKTVKIVPVL